MNINLTYLIITVLILIFWVLDDYHSIKILIPLLIGYILGQFNFKGSVNNTCANSEVKDEI